MKQLSTVGKVLSNLRVQKDQSLRDQAAELGISPSYLVDIQYGRRELSYNVYKSILEHNVLDKNEMINLGVSLNSPDVFERFKEVTGITDTYDAVKQFIYIITGEEI